MEDVKISQMSVHLGAWTPPAEAPITTMSRVPMLFRFWLLKVPQTRGTPSPGVASACRQHYNWSQRHLGRSAIHFSTLRLFFTEKTPETPLA